MKTKKNTAGLILFICTTLALGYCAKKKEDPADTGDTMADAEAVRQAKNTLEIGYAQGDSATSVTENITLPTEAENGVAITWASSHPGIISTGGVVTRPDDMTTEVILTATLTKNAARDTQRFTLTVLITEDAQAVMRAKDALTITYAQGDSASGVAADITLPTAGAGGVAISWASSAAGVISASGTVTRPDMNTEVTLTATLTKNTARDTKTFTLTALVAPADDAAAVAQAKTILTIGYAQGDRVASVTQDLAPLPTAGPDGVAISWASTQAAIISTAGVVTQPHAAANVEVTLTATLSKGSESDTKAFTLTVIARNFAWSQVSLAEGASIWSARYSHEALVLNGKIWVMGGTPNTLDGYNDVWSSTDGTGWTNANASGHWSARWGHTAVVFNGKMWVLGGNGEGESNNDVWWSSNGARWTNANASRHWAARDVHTMVVFDDKMWVLGGFVGINRLNDVWWSDDGATWTNANASSHWSARQSHAAVVFDNKMWVLGGYDGSSKNDVWWSVDGSSWTNANASSHWSARSLHAAVVFDGKMWVLGGQDGSSRLNDVWWSVDGASWTKLTNGTSHWSARSEHTAVALGDKMFLLGGRGAGGNDVWVYQESGN